MSTDVKIAVIVAATLLLIVAVCAFDRWCARHLTVAERLAFPLFVVIIDDPTEETSAIAGEEGEVEPASPGLDLAADEAMALLDPALTLRDESIEVPRLGRCGVCGRPTGGTWDCGRCFVADDSRAERRADV